MKNYLPKNLILLKKKLPELHDKLKDLVPDEKFSISLSKSGFPTISIKGKNKINKYINSKYDPVKEAKQLIDKNFINKNSNYILLGLGLGFHLQALIKKVDTSAKIIIFEKSLSLARLAFTHNDFSDALNHPGVSFYININPNTLQELIYEERTDIAIHGYSIINIKTLINLEKPYYTSIKNELEQSHQKFQININTQAAFSKIFYKNIFNNVKKTINSPGIKLFKDKFSGKPALIVSAGPSLDKNIGIINSVRKNILVITVSTALKPLLQNGIKPDFVVAVDPNADTLQSFYFEKIPKDMWLINDPCIPSTVCSLFNGRSIMIDSSIPLAKWITDHSETKGSLNNIYSVAHAAFYFSRHIGCEPIILVGQDLSFDGYRMHCKGTFYNQKHEDNIHSDTTLALIEYNNYKKYSESITSTLDIFDNSSNTTKAMETYKYQFKYKTDQESKILNATEGGVDIPGVENISLKEALNKYCRKNIASIKNSVMSSIKTPNKNPLLKDSIKKQKLKFKNLVRNLENIKKANQLLEIKLIDKNKFVLEMEKFYKDMISDTNTITLIQGYDYLAFIQWNQNTRKINNLINQLNNDSINQKKFTRDYDFFHTILDSLNFLCNEFEKLESL
jgi:hypothetical protein